MTPLEQFLSKGGTVVQVPEGQRTASEKDIQKAVRGMTDTCVPVSKSAEQKVSETYGDSLNGQQFLAAVERTKIEEGS